MLLLIAFYAAVLFITAWSLTAVFSGATVSPRLNAPSSQSRSGQR